MHVHTHPLYTNALKLCFKMPYCTFANKKYTVDAWTEWNLYQTLCMCTHWHSTQINVSLTIMTSSHDTLSHNLHLTGTCITAYSEIWFAESKLVTVQQCSVHTLRGNGRPSLPKRSTEPLKEIVILKGKFIRKSKIIFQQWLWGVECAVVQNRYELSKTFHSVNFTTSNTCTKQQQQ